MCILVLQRAGQTIVKKRLKAMYDNNPDGAGFAYVNTDHLGKKKLITYKSMVFNKFYKKLRRAERLNPESNFLIHTRIATSGELSTHNCHPFQINHDVVMGHNGIISAARRDPDGLDNDTRMFVRDTVQELPEDFMYNNAICDMMGSYIGAGSKLIFLNVDNEYVIINEDKGNWVDDVWYSNTSYKPRVACEYKNYTPPRPQRKINEASHIECDYCGTFTRVALLKPYKCYGFMEGFCSKCEARLLEVGSVVGNEIQTTGSFIKAYNDFEKFITQVM